MEASTVRTYPRNLSAAEKEYVARTAPRCEHTGLTKPECSCQHCIREILDRFMPAA